jgi:arsenate reductase
MSINMITLYGIKNCDTMKKAQQWLFDHNITYHFYDYKKEGVSEALLSLWIKEIGIELLINKRGSTWRNLDDLAKKELTPERALHFMLTNTSIIKRPVLITPTHKVVGFNPNQYEDIFN